MSSAQPAGCARYATTHHPPHTFYHPPSTSVAGKVHWRNTLEQLSIVGPKSLGVCLLTSAFIGMVFTIQFIR